MTLRAGLGSRSADKRLCEAANRILGGLEHPNVSHAVGVERDARERLVVVYAHDGLEPAGLHLGSNDATFVAYILHEVCNALDAAHGLGVIHGALTPAAVRLEPHVDTPRVRVCDFGLGHLFGSAAELEGRVTWLPYSPEKQLGLEPTPAEDVYLLGVLGYALLTGQPLFEAPTHKQVLRMHALESSVERVRATPGCEPWLAEVLARCLETEPDDRHPCPADVADALRPHLPAPKAAPAPKTKALGVVPTPPAPPRERPPKVDDGPALPAFEVSATVVRADSSPVPDPTPTATAAVETEAPVSRPWMRHVLAAAGVGLLGLGVWALLMPSATETQDATAPGSSAASMAAAADASEAVAGRSEASPVPAQPDPPAKPDPEPQREPLEAEPLEEGLDGADDAEVDLLEEPSDEADAGLAEAALDLDRPPVDPQDPGLTPDQRRTEAQQLCLEALSARRSGRTNDAIRLYKRALAVRANHAPASHALGTIYFNRRDYQTAIRYEKKAAQAQPKQSAYQLALGDYYYKSGNGSKARKHWTKASRLGSRLAKKRLAEE